MGHHLILGELCDFITGERLSDTHDERHRQRLFRHLVERKGFHRSDILPRQALVARAGNRSAVIFIDCAVRLNQRLAMLIKYGPGSIVTRHRSALAASRLLAPYQIPLAVATNGVDADVLEGLTGKVLGQGLDAVPQRDALMQRTHAFGFPEIDPARAVMESRIVYTFEVEGSCPCDDTICRLE